MKLPIYLDYAATTPVDPRVAEKMMNFLTLDGIFGNPSSKFHRFGWQAEEAVDIARNQVAKLINANPRDIIFTSGATESINLAIKGILNNYNLKDKHIITSKTEHKSVIDTCKQLEKEGFSVTYLIPNNNGIITIDQLRNAIRDNTVLVSIMHVNNEIGIIQDIFSISKLCHEYDIIFHVDATQSVGKLQIDLNKSQINLMSFSAHKIYGPKGIGALYIDSKSRMRIVPQMHGGGHERGIRSGTLPVHQIVGMGEACYIANRSIKEEMIRFNILRDRLWKGINIIDNVYINGDLSKSIPNILNIRFFNVDGELLIISLKDLALSSGSACTSANFEPSYVLRAIGLKEDLAHNSLRISFGRFTTEEEIDYAIYIICKSVNNLRKLKNVTI